ncbi:hypothetical protein SLS58_010575 [Diplodia intermedia]|uniref:N-acetyltransferase domain-containing protein n=1 Tax=Diplodia intermedia TaxID=856260 RepID=A0ABR3T528_9PEZI
MNALSPPYPFLFDDWRAWFAAADAKARAARADLAAVERGERRWVGTGLAFTAIREVVVVGDGDGEEEVFLGKVEIRRADYRTVADEERREAKRRANGGLEAGDVGIEWEVGFWLCPEAHGRGIMTTVLRTLLDTFFVEYMNVRNLKGSCLTHNKASKRVLEKCGFVFESEEHDIFEVAESKTGVKGQRVGAIHMRWKAA